MAGAHTSEFHNIETGIMTERRFISVVPSNHRAPERAGVQRPAIYYGLVSDGDITLL